MDETPDSGISFNSKDITSFSIQGVHGRIEANAISLTMPYGTDNTNLSPEILISGKSIDPASGIACNFSYPVDYTVTAEDGTYKIYTVNVDIASISSKDIIDFSILGVTGAIGANDISLTLPFGTDKTSLSPVITINGKSINPASGVACDFTNPVDYTVFAEDGSTKSYTINVSTALNSENDITAFSILGVPGTIGSNNISITLPYGTDKTNLSPSITINGKSLNPASGISCDFSNPVNYTVSAADGSVKLYTVNVTVAQNTEKDILAFSILGIPGTIGANNISLSMPYGTDKTNLSPVITINGKSISPVSGVASNFTNPVTYTVTANDGTTKAYTINVNVALNNEKDITGFSILGTPGTIGTNTISLTVPYGTNIINLTPAIIISGKSVTPASGVACNFTNPVTYTVTADDNSTKSYTVTVNTALNYAKDITGFSILGNSGTIGTNSISLTVPYGTNITSLTPAISISGKNISPASGVSCDFTNPVTYTVTADDNSTKTYTITVNTALNYAKDITGFSILGNSGTIGTNSISLTVPYGTNVTSLTPAITISGKSISPASGVACNFTSPVTYTVTADDNSTKTYTVNINVALNNEKDITSFSILGNSGTIGTNSISLTVPYGTNVSSLTPAITISGKSVSPASGVVCNFTNPVTYTVTADDNTTKTYTVTVNVALNDEKDITGFSILGNSGTIGTDTISLTVPYGTNVTSLTPAITISGKSISPASGVACNYTSPVTYTVTADDNSTKTYTVTVNVALNDAKDITNFTILGISGLIETDTISLTVPYGTSITNLTPAITINGKSINPASGVARNFTNPVTYTVTADDNSTKIYTVTVNTALNDAKDITSFTIQGITGSIQADTISLTVPYLTNVTNLSPVIAITGDSISPASGVACNFSTPVSYVVTAADGSTKIYTVTVTTAAAGTIYWTESGGAINNVANDGTGKVTILTATGTPLDIALDQTNNKIYWAEYYSTSAVYRIRRANFNGSSPENFSSEYSSGSYFGPTTIAIDSQTGKIYWNQYYTSNGVYTSNLTGTFAKTLVKDGISPYYTHSICFDTVHKYFYMTTNSYWNILTPVKGSGNTNVLCYGNASTFSSPISFNGMPNLTMQLRGVAVDPTGGRVYFVSNDGSYIRRTSSLTLSANDHEVWISSSNIQKLALDLTNRKIYWTSDTTGYYRIYRADLDTAQSNVEVFLSLSGKPTGITIAQ